MVQISNTLIIAAAIVPALAAPVLDAREPFDKAAFKRVAKIGGKVASGASLAATVVPLVQQRDLEEIDQRGFHGLSGLRKAGKIAGKVADGASLASNVASVFQQREFETDNLEAREPRITSSQARAIAKGAGDILHHAQNGIEFGAAVAPLLPHHRRSLEDLEARGKFHVSSDHVKLGGGVAAAAAGFAGTVAIMNTQQHRRDFDDFDTRASELDARDPKFNFGKVFGKVAGIASNFIRDDETGDIYVREYDDAELDARDPKFNFGKVFGKVAGIASNFIRDDETGDIYVREYDDAELDARDPKFNFGKVFGKVAGIAGNFIRDDETGDIYVREYDDAELDARDPKFNFGKVFGKVAGIASNFIRETPEFDELD